MLFVIKILIEIEFAAHQTCDIFRNRPIFLFSTIFFSLSDCYLELYITGYIQYYNPVCVTLVKTTTTQICYVACTGT